MISVNNLGKHFVLHNQGGIELNVLDNISLEVKSGDCLVLHGPSGTGKSTLLRSLYANYLPQKGEILIKHNEEIVDIVSAPPHKILEVRQYTVGYVSQFLRVIPRVNTLDIVSEPLRRQGIDTETAKQRAAEILERLNIPKHLWHLAPSTFSGGEQQRVNIAHCFVTHYPIMLLDEPTASLDAANREVVIQLIQEAKDRGAALVGIFHDEEVRDAVGTHFYDIHTNSTRRNAA